VAYFISYSRRDDAAVRIIAEDLERTHHEVWLDQELGGGEEWWTEILRRIRSSDVFVLALSRASLASRPCTAELAYANALGIPVLPVQVGEVESLRMTPISDRQIIDYRERVHAYVGRSTLIDVSVGLAVAALELTARRGALPDPLPAPPPIPFEYLMQLRLAVDAPELAPRVQLQVLTQLKQALRDEEDAVARQDLVDLLRRLRSHPDITYRNAQEIDDIVARPDAVEATDHTEDVHPVAGRAPSPPPAARERTPAPPDAEPVPAVGPTPPDRAVAAVRPAPLSFVAAVLGALGLGQAGPLFAYTPTFYYIADLATGAYRFDTRPFITTMWVVLVLAGAGVVIGGVAVHRGEPQGRVATGTACLGVVVVAAVLLAYRA
jgi:hypothetical protein